MIYLVSGRDAENNRLTEAQLRCLADSNPSLVNYDGRNALHRYLETSFIEVEIVKRLCEPTTKLINKKFRGTQNPNVLFTLLEAVTRQTENLSGAFDYLLSEFMKRRLNIFFRNCQGKDIMEKLFEAPLEATKAQQEVYFHIFEVLYKVAESRSVFKDGTTGVEAVLRCALKFGEHTNSLIQIFNEQKTDLNRATPKSIPNIVAYSRLPFMTKEVMDLFLAN